MIGNMEVVRQQFEHFAGLWVAGPNETSSAAFACPKEDYHPASSLNLHGCLCYVLHSLELVPLLLVQAVVHWINNHYVQVGNTAECHHHCKVLQYMSGDLQHTLERFDGDRGADPSNVPSIRHQRCPHQLPGV